MRKDNDDNWHLDKKVPISFIGVLVVYALIAVAQYTKVAQQVETNTDKIKSVQSELTARMGRDNAQAVRHYDDIKSILNRIEDKLEKKVDK